jgi:hypothetical protein
MKISLKSQLTSAVKDELPGGLADDKSLQDIANKHGAPLELIQLMFKWGTDVEMEHTNDPALAKEIAMDHLMEDPIYYKKLKEMEGE